MLVALRAGLERVLAVVGVDAIGFHFYVAVRTVIAGEALRCGSRLADGLIAVAGDHVAVATKGILVKGHYFVAAVGGRVIDGADTQLPLAEAEVYVSRFVLIVPLDHLRAGI